MFAGLAACQAKGSVQGPPNFNGLANKEVLAQIISDEALDLAVNDDGMLERRRIVPTHSLGAGSV